MSEAMSETVSETVLCCSGLCRSVLETVVCCSWPTHGAALAHPLQPTQSTQIQHNPACLLRCSSKLRPETSKAGDADTLTDPFERNSARVPAPLPVPVAVPPSYSPSFKKIIHTPAGHLSTSPPCLLKTHASASRPSHSKPTRCCCGSPPLRHSAA